MIEETITDDLIALKKMEFFGMDVVVPAGDGIQLLVSQTGEDYIPSPVSTQAATISLDGNSVLGLSTVDRTCEDLFLPPMHEMYPQCSIDDNSEE